MAAWQCWGGAQRLIQQLFRARPKEASVLVALVCVSAVAHAWVWVKFSSVNGAAQTALSKRDEAAFWHSRWDLMIIIMKLVATSICENYCAGRLRLLWRSVATRGILGEYLPDGRGAGLKPMAFIRATSGAADQEGKPFPFYRLKLPEASPAQCSVKNPDQRIADDIHSAVADVVDLGRSLLGNLVSFAGFATIMIKKSPWVFHALMLYALAGTFITLKGFASGLTSAQINLRDREAHFRSGLVKVDECAEGIAFYGAAGAERQRLLASFRELLLAGFRTLRWQTGLQTFQRFYSWFTIVLPSVIMAPQYFRGEVEFGAISEMFFAFNSVKGVLMFVANNFGSLAALRAKLERVEALRSSLLLDGQPLQKRGDSLPLVMPEKTSCPKIFREWPLEPMAGGALLSVEALRILAPGSETRRSLGSVGGDPSGSYLRLLPGEALLLRGPSGVGKSSLLRVVAGLWDEGTGMVQIGTSEVYFLPQTPYLPFGAHRAASSLRDQLLFPEQQPAELSLLHKGAQLVACNRQELPSDDKLLEAIEAANLSTVLEAAGSLDAEVDWSTRLSGGERQRLAFARLFARLPRKAQPSESPCLILLDEATSACDEEAERYLYEELLSRVQMRRGALLSVGHRGSLRPLHTREVELEVASLPSSGDEGIRKKHL